MHFAFEYPVSRPYPWRRATLSIVLLSTVVFGLLVYFNMTIVGVTTYSRNSPVFMKWNPPTWRDRLNIKKMANYAIGCESATLVAGGSYQTQNQGFAYNIESFHDTSTGEPFPTAQYNGTAITNCVMNEFSLTTSFANLEARFETTIRCALEAGVDITLSASSTARRFSLSSIGRHNFTTRLAGSAAKLLQAFGSDVFEGSIFWTLPQKGWSDYPTVMTTTYNFTPDATLRMANILVGCLQWFRDDVEGYQSITTRASIPVIENYMRIWSALILSDLGVRSPQNPLTSAEAFQSAITELDWTWRYDHPNYRIPPYANLIQGANMSQYDIPFDVQPTYFNAWYLCHYISWKPWTGMVVDVFVATASLFLSFWAIMKLALVFFASRSSPTANFCICPKCNYSASQENHHLLRPRSPKYELASDP